jgi:hypothetical protein
MLETGFIVYLYPIIGLMTAYKDKDITRSQRRVLLWIASCTGIRPVIPARGNLRTAVLNHYQKYIFSLADLSGVGVPGEAISYASEGRRHVPWSSQRYFRRKFTKSESVNLSATLRKLEQRGLVKRIDRRRKGAAGKVITHARLTDHGAHYVESFWAGQIDRLLDEAPPPVPNPLIPTSTSPEKIFEETLHTN